MKEETCKRCGFHGIGFKGKIWCNLAHDFIDNLGDFCPKEHSIEEIRERCERFIPRLADGESCCTAHLAEGRAFPCWIKELRDLLRDPLCENLG